MVIRKIEVLRAAWGAALLIAPQRVLRDVHHVQIDTKSVVIARILGVRHLTQAVLSGISPSPEVLAMGVWVDAAHASTALALAVVDRARARAGFTDTAIAGAFAGLGYRDLATFPATSCATAPGHDRRRDTLARGCCAICRSARSFCAPPPATRPEKRHHDTAPPISLPRT